MSELSFIVTYVSQPIRVWQHLGAAMPDECCCTRRMIERENEDDAVFLDLYCYTHRTHSLTLILMQYNSIQYIKSQITTEKSPATETEEGKSAIQRCNLFVTSSPLRRSHPTALTRTPSVSWSMSRSVLVPPAFVSGKGIRRRCFGNMLPRGRRVSMRSRQILKCWRRILSNHLWLLLPATCSYTL